MRNQICFICFSVCQILVTFEFLSSSYFGNDNFFVYLLDANLCFIVHSAISVYNLHICSDAWLISTRTIIVGSGPDPYVGNWIGWLLLDGYSIIFMLFCGEKERCLFAVNCNVRWPYVLFSGITGPITVTISNHAMDYRGAVWKYLAVWNIKLK